MVQELQNIVKNLVEKYIVYTNNHSRLIYAFIKLPYYILLNNTTINIISYKINYMCMAYLLLLIEEDKIHPNVRWNLAISVDK